NDLKLLQGLRRLILGIVPISFVIYQLATRVVYQRHRPYLTLAQGWPTLLLEGSIGILLVVSGIYRIKTSR
ncbi:MAG TPA: hypothetical protein VGF75_07215, partial [Candidatus Saccharimonadales bacterium]